MRKGLLPVIAILCLLLLAACGGSEPKPPISDTPFGVGETAVFKDLKFTALRVQESFGDQFWKPDEGKVFVGVEFLIENISDKDYSISSLMMFTAYADGFAVSFSLSAEVFFGDTLGGTISPGKKLQGYYALEVPANWQEIEIQIIPELFSTSKAVFVFNK
ncbi:MAG: DUF4352 domain-containing protein [Clostridiales bacterium]|nr:DUF4352 domain-containing protein [Clostridiales bacterium]